MITVAEEVTRAVQIASAPKKVVSSRDASSAEEVISSSSSSNSREVANIAGASRTAVVPSNNPPPPPCPPSSLTVRRSPAFSSDNNRKVDLEESSGGKEEEKKIPVKLKRPRDAQMEGTVTCKDCGTQLHWAGLARHRKMCHLRGKPLESGVIGCDEGLKTFLLVFVGLKEE